MLQTVPPPPPQPALPPDAEPSGLAPEPALAAGRSKSQVQLTPKGGRLKPLNRSATDFGPK